MTAQQRRCGVVLLVGLAVFAWDLVAFSLSDALLDLGVVAVVFALIHGWSICEIGSTIRHNPRAHADVSAC